MRFPKSFKREKRELALTGDHAQAKTTLSLTLGQNQTGNLLELNATGKIGGSLFFADSSANFTHTTGNVTLTAGNLTVSAGTASFYGLLYFGNNSGATTASWGSVSGFPDRALLTFTNNSGGVQIYDDGSQIQFGTTSGRGFNWTPATRVINFDDGTLTRFISGNGNTYGNYTQVTHNGTDGVISTNTGAVKLSPAGTLVATVATTATTFIDAYNIIVGSTTGTKIGTATSQKIGFFNSTPVVQQTGNIITGLSNLGLITSGSISSANLGSGTANSSTFLRGDLTWATVTASAGGSTTQIQYNNAGAIAGTSGFTWDSTNLALTLVSSTLSGTTSFPAISLAQTWNNSGGSFTGFLVNITNTLSASTSKLMDVQIGGTSKFNLGISTMTLADAYNIAVGTSTGTIIGTSTSQKIGFFNATPVVQQTGDISTALSSLGLVTSGTLGAGSVTGTLGVTHGGTGTATSFTTGSVVFAGASGVYSQNNSKLFWDNTNNFLGVGTASPGNPLDVVINSSSSGQSTIGATNTNSSGKAQVFITGDVVNVSLGVFNSAFAVPQLQNVAGLACSGNLSLIGSSGVPNGGSGIIIFSPTGYADEGMRFNASKRLLIGKTSDDGSNMLQVNGTAIFNGVTIADAGNFVVGTSTGTKIGTSTSQKIGFFNATPIVQPSSTTDLRTALINLGLYATGGASPLNLNGGALTAASLTLSSPLTVGNGGTGTATAFTAGSVVFAGTSGVYSQDNSNFFWDSTNHRLGIGSSSPTAKIFVSGSTVDNGSTSFGDAISLTSTVTNGSANLALNTTSKYAVLVLYGSTQGGPQANQAVFNTSTTLTFLTDGNISSGGSSLVKFITGGFTNNPTMTFTGGNPGNVLIGTTSDNGNLLQVNGAVSTSKVVLTTTGSLTLGQLNILGYNLQTTNNTVTTIATIATSSSTVYWMDVKVAGRRSDTGTENIVHLSKWLVDNESGTLTIQQVGSIEQFLTTLSTATVSVTSSSSNILVQVTGETSKTIKWSATVSIQGTPT